MKKIIHIWAYCLFAIVGYSQQDVMLTQFMYNKISINPAFASITEQTEAAFTLRNQWTGFPGAPKTQLITLSHPLPQQNAALGLKIQNQSLGISQNTNLSLMYAYGFSIQEDSKISLGISATGKRYSFDFTDDRLIALHDITLDPSIPKENITKFLMNIGFGIYYQTSNHYVSLSTSGILNNDIDFAQSTDVKSPNARQLYLMGGYSFELSERIALMPQVLFKYSEESPLDIDINGGVIVDKMYSTSLTYRAGGNDIGESLDFLFGMQVNDQLHLAFSYDFVLSKLRSYQSGSLEFSVQYGFGSGTSNSMINPRHF